MNRFRNSVVVVVFALLGSATSVARAQGVQDQVEQLNREAMEAYNNLDINTAGQKLEEALRLAQEGGLAGAPVAITNLNMGMVYIGGLGDVPGGTSFFVAAICNDPSVQLDPLVSTPEMQAAFGQAQVQAQQNGCVTSGGQAGPTGVTQPIQQVAPLVHVPPAEAKSQTPLPLYVEVSSAVGAERVFLHYKGLGMDTYKKVPMYSFGQGMAYQIPCNDVWEPKVSYYIEAVSSSGQSVGSVGSEAVPIEVAVVGALSQQGPALPGRPTPASCAAGECPPGVTCDKPGTLGIGESCDADKDCESGLICGAGDVCKLDGAGGTSLGSWGGDDYDEEPGSADFSRLFFQLGFTFSFPFVTEGMPVDRLPPPDRVFVNDQTGLFTDTFGPGDALVLPYPEPGSYPELVTEWVPDGDSSDSVGNYGGSCSADGTATGPGMATLYPSSYCARVGSAGFDANLALRANVGYFFTDRIAGSLLFRFQFDSGVGSMSSLLFGARAEYLITDPVAEGFMLSGFAGLSFGQIQAQPSYENGSDEQSPYIKSGLFGGHVGANVRYRFHRNFGVYAGPELDLQFPDFLFNIDIPIGVEVAFL